jgi:hypothetical protein
MANRKQEEILKRGCKYWNDYRKENNSLPNLKGSKLRGFDLTGYDLRGADFSGANLIEAILKRSDLTKVCLNNANLSGANLTGANMYKTKIFDGYLPRVNLTRANLRGADFSGAYLVEAILRGADLRGTNLSGANLSKSNMEGAICVDTILTNASIENARIYGVSVWDIKIEGLKQKNLVITREAEPVITVDNIEVAQFIYLILNNEKIRDVIGTIAKKGVLILGRFNPERKQILDAIRDKLREHDFVPIMFDFDKVESRDFTETIKILAGMSRFVIVDITNPKSSPLELQATIPDYKIPFLPIIHQGETPFSMFADLQQKYNWVLPTMRYSSEAALLKGFKKGIIDKALEVDKRLFDEKQATPPDMVYIEDFED